jgi:hypothetical protein
MTEIELNSRLLPINGHCLYYSIVVIARGLFRDSSKASDLIDHDILLQKVVDDGLPDHTPAWSIDLFLGVTIKIDDNC